MAEPLDVKHLLASGKRFADSGRAQARQLGTDLVGQGRVATEQIAVRIDDLAGRGSRERFEELRQSVRAEMHQELRTLRESISEDLARSQLVVDGIAAMVNELDRQGRDREEELREKVRAEFRMLRDSLNEDLAKVEAGVARITAVVDEERSEHRERE